MTADEPISTPKSMYTRNPADRLLAVTSKRGALIKLGKQEALISHFCDIFAQF